MAKKLPGLDKFTEALRVVGSVPKEQADAKVDANKKARLAAKKSKRKKK